MNNLYHSVEHGDTVVWHAPDGPDVYGTVERTARRVYVNWEGGRREPLDSNETYDDIDVVGR